MFDIQKAKSRTCEVEYVKIKMNDLRELSEETPNEVKEDKRFIKHVFTREISEKSTIVAEKLMNKRGKLLGYSFGVKYIAWMDESRPVVWTAVMSFDPEGRWSGGSNYETIHFSADREDYAEFYLVFDGGFNAPNMTRAPYFLTKYNFEYIYEKVS